MFTLLLMLSLQIPQESRSYDQMLREAHQVNALAQQSKLESRQNVAAYVNLLVSHLDIQSPLLSAEMKELVIEAELQATRNQKRLISDTTLARTFNEIMQEIHAPPEMRVTPNEVHNYRDAMSVLKDPKPWVYPNSMARRRNGRICNGARPVEALLTLFLLQNVPENILWARERVRKRILISTLVSEPLDSARGEASLRIQETPEVERKYQDALRNYTSEKGAGALPSFVHFTLKKMFRAQQDLTCNGILAVGKQMK